MWSKNKVQEVTDSILQNLEPLNCDLSKLGPLHYASVFAEAKSGIISESVACGMDLDQDVAVLKAVVEFVEGRALQEARAQGAKSGGLGRSDGLAAFPRGLGEEAGCRARKNALAEAIERFAWSTWWDDSDVSFESFSGPEFLIAEESRRLVKEIEKLIPISRMLRIQPTLENPEHSVVIFFFLLKNGGVISGGAAGGVKDGWMTELRALGELARHADCARRIIRGLGTPETFYEKRLAFMASKGGDLLLRRLSNKGGRTIHLPKLSCDEPIVHRLSPQVAVHRCYFEGQPEFIGGQLERLCL